jgi:hypothetical protein
MSDRDFPFLLSKRSHGLTDLAPRKVLKTASASAAGAAPGLAVQLTFSQDAPQRGAQAAPVAVERVLEAGPSVDLLSQPPTIFVQKPAIKSKQISTYKKIYLKTGAK